MSANPVPVAEPGGPAVAEPAGPAVVEPAELDAFIRLSEVLLDAHGRLPRAAAAEVYAIVVAAAPARYGIDGTQPPMTALLATFNEVAADGPDGLEDRLVSVLYADGTLGPMAKNLIITWYNGGLGLAVLSPANYGAALVWPAISAEPPGLPGPYFGNWAYPPPGLVAAPTADTAAPAQASPMQPTPAQATTAQPAPAQATPVQATPVQVAAAQRAPTEPPERGGQS